MYLYVNVQCRFPTYATRENHKIIHSMSISRVILTNENFYSLNNMNTVRHQIVA